MSWISLILISLTFTTTSIATTNSKPNLAIQQQPKLSNNGGETEIVGDYACRIIGECEPCPIDSLNESYCKLTGNRKKLSCLSLISSSFSTKPLTNILSPPPKDDSISIIKNNGHSVTSPIQSLTNSIISPFQDSTSSPLTSNLPIQEQIQVEINLLREKVQEKVKQDGLGLDPDPEGIDDEIFKDTMRESTERNYKRQLLKEESNLSTLIVMGGDQEIIIWEACQHVLSKERADFFEFIYSNLFIAIVSLTILIFRSRTLAERQYGRLAARIGVSFIQHENEFD